MKRKQAPKRKIRNFVAKNSHKFNKSEYFVDKKQKDKIGYQKHKNFLIDPEEEGKA